MRAFCKNNHIQSCNFNKWISLNKLTWTSAKSGSYWFNWINEYLSSSGECLNNNRQSSMKTFLHLTKYWIQPNIYFIKQINVNFGSECWIIALIVSGIEKFRKEKLRELLRIFSWFLRKNNKYCKKFSCRRIFPRFSLISLSEAFYFLSCAVILFQDMQ